MNMVVFGLADASRWISIQDNALPSRCCGINFVSNGKAYLGIDQQFVFCTGSWYF